MSTRAQKIARLRNKKYRDAFVASQISVGLPFQIRALREQRGWKQSRLASETGMLQPRISAMESPGGTKYNLETLRRLASAFDVALLVRFAPFSELVEWSDKFNPDNFRVPSFVEEQVEIEAQPAREAARGPSLEQIANVSAGEGMEPSLSGATRRPRTALADYDAARASDWAKYIPDPTLTIPLAGYDAARALDPAYPQAYPAAYSDAYDTFTKTISAAPIPSGESWPTPEAKQQAKVINIDSRRTYKQIEASDPMTLRAYGGR